MSKFLQTLLGADEPLFSYGLQKLEKSTGHSGVDIRLIADINHRTHQVMRKLKLDTADTTGPELYHALISSVKSGAFKLLLAETDYCLIALNGEIISLNMIDVVENAHHHLSVDRQILEHGRRALRGEIVARYIEHGRTNEVTTLEIAEMMGLLSPEDECYNILNHKRKQTE